MAQLDFFGLDEDFYALIEFVLADTGMTLYEAYSRVDEDIRRIRSVDELRAMAGERKRGGFLLRGWIPGVCEEPEFETLPLDPAIGIRRTCLGGAGVMQFYQGVPDRGYLLRSTFSHWNEAGAVGRAVEGAELVDWKAMRRHSGRIHRYVRNHLAVARTPTAPVLPSAYAALASGLIVWDGQEFTQETLEPLRPPAIRPGPRVPVDSVELTRPRGVTTWIALLRAVNVGGTGKLAMADLRALCETIGFDDVRTYIASGNVVLRCAGDEMMVKRSLEVALERHMGKPVGVLVRSAAEMAAIAARIPFPDAAPNRTVVVFFDDPLVGDPLAGARHVANERVVAIGRELHIAYGEGMADSKLVLPAAKHGTGRNRNTVAKLAAIAAG